MILIHTKKSRRSTSKSSYTDSPIIILDDSSKLEKSRRSDQKIMSKSPRKPSKKSRRKSIEITHKTKGKGKRVVSSDSYWEEESGDEGEDIGLIVLDQYPGISIDRIMNFMQRKVLRGRLITWFGGEEIGELRSLLNTQGWTNFFLQGTSRRRMGRMETCQFYINVIGSPSSISSTVRGEELHDYTR